jgi:hypothetical protein
MEPAERDPAGGPDPTGPGYIYLIVEREFVRSGEPVFKAGRAANVIARFKQYPKGSQLISVSFCTNMLQTENEVLAALAAAFNRRTDIGREYFQGDKHAVITLVQLLTTAKLAAAGPASGAAVQDNACMGGQAAMSMHPSSLIDAKDESMLDGNMLYQFLVASNGSGGTRYVRQASGSFIDWSELNSAFIAYMRRTHAGKAWTLSTNAAWPLRKLGYELLHGHICCSCGGHSLSGCCSDYSRANRVKRWRIHNMELVPQPPPSVAGPTGTL